MQNNIYRAVQFQPFDALKGFREALAEVEREKEEKKEFSDDFFKELDQNVRKAHKGDWVIVEHYYEFQYLKTYGRILKMDSVHRVLFLEDSKIFFDDIVGFRLLHR